MLDVFDSHCHVGPAPGDHGERPEPVQEYRVSGRLLCGVSPGDWDLVEAEAARSPATIPAFGLHPWEIANVNAEWFAVLDRKLSINPDAWLGEAGLDRVRTDGAEFAEQTEVLAAQLQLAKRLGRPASLHCVRAWEDILPLLDRHFLWGRSGLFIMHAFAGPSTYVKALVARGAYFSIGTAICNREFRRQRECAEAIPADRLLIESDAYVAAPDDGLADLAAVIAELAALRDCRAERLAEQAFANSQKVFHGDE